MLRMSEPDQWDFPFVRGLREALGYLGLNLLSQSDTVLLAVCSVLTGCYVVLLLIVGVPKKVLPKGLRALGLKTVALWLAVVQPAFGVLFAALLGHNLGCPGFSYNAVCLAGSRLVLFVLSAVGVLLHVVLVLLGVLYFHVANPVLPCLFSGGSKEQLLVREAERLAYGLYLALRQGPESDKQFVVFMALLALFKVYQRFTDSSLSDLRLNAAVVFLQAFGEAFAVLVCLLLFAETNPANPTSFVLAMLVSLGAGLCAQRLSELLFFRRAEGRESPSGEDDQLRKDVAEASVLFLVTAVNLRHGHFYRRKMEALLFAHRRECREAGCSCAALEGRQLKREDHQTLTGECLRFWNGRLKAHLQSGGSSPALLLQSMSVSVLHSGEVLSVLAGFRRLQQAKSSFSQAFESTILRCADKVLSPAN